MGKKYAFYGTAFFFMLMSFLATVKICFVYLNIDEEYAVTLSWRIISEDRMFLDIWEPHQTSGFLTAFLCWIYQRVTGTAEYLGSADPGGCQHFSVPHADAVLFALWGHGGGFLFL